MKGKKKCYNAGGPVRIPGVDVMKDAQSNEDAFKKGGKVKKKAVGAAEGEKGAARLDRPKRASGGAVTSRGRSPWSSASNVTSAPAKSPVNN